MNVPQDIMTMFNIACKSDSTILITGSTGTGKSSLARQIHEGSKRKNKPFIVVNLASLYEGTLESELFGHERGSFTGAEIKRIGRFELAQGGTVFLDEVGELRASLQARLLEFLQSKVISPVGSNREISLDVRIIAATHKDLASSVRKHEFREDLFHRLRVVSVPMKSLKDRREEFVTISEKTIADLCRREGRGPLVISPHVTEIFNAYSWPGNIRELRNALEYAVLSTEGSVIHPENLPAWLIQDFQQETYCLSRSNLTGADALQAETEGHLGEVGSEFGVLNLSLGTNYNETCNSFEKEYLQRALLRNGGRINRTARQIGLNKSTLMRRMRSFGLTQNVFQGH